MRWRYRQAEFYPGFDPSGFLTTPYDQGPDTEGVRTILCHYQIEGSTRVIPLAIDTDEDTADVYVVTNADGVGHLKIRLVNDASWTDITDDWTTSFQLPNISGFVNVDIQVTFPTGEPVEIPISLLWDIPNI